MKNVQLGLHYLPYSYLQDPNLLNELIYPNMYKNYYWSDDFSAEYYMAQAKAGFIAVTDHYEGKELLLPEIQFTYALLDFKDLHISRKVLKLLQGKELRLEISRDLDEVAAQINAFHKNCWLSPRYLEMLKTTQGLDDNFELVAVSIKDKDIPVAGEIGYFIGRTYTSLSGFSSREKQYSNYGTAQLVLLARFLQKNNVDFWNLGQPYMTYKLQLGAKIYERQKFLKRWFKAANEILSI